MDATQPAHNQLYYGDNLDVLRRFVKDASIDLVYLDPPFKSNQDYNVIFQEQDGARSTAQIKAFEDTWCWDQGAEEAYERVVERGGTVSEALQAFRKILRESDMMAYLAYMAPRLIELKRILKDSGSLYLHCDPTASHYLKTLLDAVFGAKNFLNEIIWHYRKWTTGKYTFQRNHDVVLFYRVTSSKARTFNQLFMERAASTQRRFGQAKILSGFDRRGHRLPSETEEEESLGARQDDVWDIGRVPPIKQLFPTEKPLALLERVIRASSNEGDVVLDPFCGCGTTVVAAQMMNRRWIGIDITHLAITLIRHRLRDRFEGSAKYEVIGEPVSLPDAMALAKQDRYQFQWWALGLVDARPEEEKKGADSGVDGRLYFHDEARAAQTKKMVLQVKSGHVTVKDVRDLRGVMERDKAQIAALITLEEATKPMVAEAAKAGFYKSLWWNKKFPRLQILTIADLLAGKRIDYPPSRFVNVTFKRAPRTSNPGHGDSTELLEQNNAEE
jgi:DNA modification methylase